MLKIVEKAPAAAGNIFLRHRQICQKLRKTSPASAGLVCCNQQKMLLKTPDLLAMNNLLCYTELIVRHLGERCSIYIANALVQKKEAPDGAAKLAVGGFLHN